MSGALGALMAFATSPWYAGHARLGLAPFDLSPAEDQQIAGLLMWVPGGLVHAGAALLVMRRLLRPLMRDRLTPSSLVWLAVLLALPVAIAAIRGGTIYL